MMNEIIEIGEKAGPVADSGESPAMEFTSEDERKKLMHRERSRTYYWRHRDRLREEARGEYRKEREKEKQLRKINRGGAVIFTASLIVMGAAIVAEVVRQRKQQESQAILQSIQGPKTYDIGEGRIIQMSTG